MKNFLNINDLNEAELFALLERSGFYKRTNCFKRSLNKSAALMFLEPSTRTKASFEMALHRLGWHTLMLDAPNSSLNKGESLLDSALTYEALGVNALIIRSQQERFYDELASLQIAVINAGDGAANHPSQSLLDIFSIYERFGGFEGLNIGICGDLKHSRIAASSAEIYKRLGANIHLIAPKYFSDEQAYKLDEIIDKLDVLIMLRVQFERHTNEQFERQQYLADFQLNATRLKRLKKSAFIMHPAPINWGLELDSCVRDDPRFGAFIQMQNGVFVRMSIIDYIQGEL